MGEFSKWLLHENQKELFDYLFAIVLNIIFLALTALLLWPLGRTTIALHLRVEIHALLSYELISAANDWPEQIEEHWEAERGLATVIQTRVLRWYEIA